MIVTKRTLPRRTFLRGAGAAIALPLLDAMVPALAATPVAHEAPRLHLSAERRRDEFFGRELLDAEGRRGKASSCRRSCGRSPRTATD